MGRTVSRSGTAFSQRYLITVVLYNIFHYTGADVSVSPAHCYFTHCHFALLLMS